MPTTYAIPDGRTVMAATLYTGAGGTQTISNLNNGVSFQPDFVWGKARSAAYGSALFDSNRGFGSTKGLVTSLTQAEGTVSAQYGYISTNTSTGFTATGGTDGSNPNAALNESGVTYVAWQWKAGGTAVSNTAGSITSQVSANTTAGFSVVTYTGNGTSGTIGHGLGVAPQMIIVKRRSAAQDWIVAHIGIGGTGGMGNNFMYLNQTGGNAGPYAGCFNNTLPTTSVFSVGNDTSTNASGSTYVAYCFAPVAGYSAFGSFTGNGSADGPFVYTGFRPAFVMAKLSSATGDWNIVDDMRQTYNDASGNPVLRANLSSAEEDVDTMQGQMDILSNGFKLRSNNSSLNASGGTIIYAAFAKSPFKYANAR